MYKLKASLLIKDTIKIWSKNKYCLELAKIIQKNQKFVKNKVNEILTQKKKSEKRKYNEARYFLLDYAITGIECKVKLDHFILFKKRETVEIIIEDIFDIDETGKIIFDNQEKVSNIYTSCLFLNENEIISFLIFFLSDFEQLENIDKISRYKTFFWFIYLIIDIVRIDSCACEKGAIYIKDKLHDLLMTVEKQKIINMEGETEKDDYEEGIWNNSFFAYLQGEDRQEFLNKLIEQFNFNNKTEHANRYLLARHRDCIYKKTYELFCEILNSLQ